MPNYTLKVKLEKFLSVYIWNLISPLEMLLDPTLLGRSLVVNHQDGNIEKNEQQCAWLQRKKLKKLLLEWSA